MEDAYSDGARSDPFEDSAGSEVTAQGINAPSMLVVDRNATLTLGTDALIVFDEGLKHRKISAGCCGLLPHFSKPTRAIPFYNILWAEVNDAEVSVHYAQPTGNDSCTIDRISYTVMDKSSQAHTERWVETVMDRAYPPNTKRKKRIHVLVNPFGGKGRAQRLWETEVKPVFAAARCNVTVDNTAFRGHATEIAKELDIDSIDVVACASGDGLPHEVFNGLAQHKNPGRALRKVAVTQLPCGSGNAMSINLNGTASPSLAGLAIVKGVRAPLDLVAITQGDNKYYSFLSQSLGWVAESDLGTESLRWMGPFRFTWGFLVRIMGHSMYPAEVSVVTDTDNKRAIREDYRQRVAEYGTAAAKGFISEDQNKILRSDGDPELPPLRYGTVTDALSDAFETEDMPELGNFYTGKMCFMSPDAPFFPTSLPSDGRMDMIVIPAVVGRIKALQMLASVQRGELMDMPDVSYRKVLAYRVTPRMDKTSPKRSIRAKIGRWIAGAGNQDDGYISIDGESVPFEPYQAEVVPGLGTVLSKRSGLYEYEEQPKSS